ncbi:MAG: hypothetical protein ACK56I_16880, partial [bacterium]
MESCPASPALLASAGQDGAVKLWDARAAGAGATGSLPHASPMYCLAWLHETQVGLCSPPSPDLRPGSPPGSLAPPSRRQAPRLTSLESTSR